MLPIDIDSLLNGSSSVEWERMEFKEGWNPLEVIQTICAFANDFNNLDGGYIIIGVAENKGKPLFPPKGLTQSQIDDIQKKLLQYGNDKINPPYHPIAIPYVKDGKNILILRVSGGQNRPYQAVDSLSKENKMRSYFIRKMSSTVKAKGSDLTELMSLAQNVPFDDRYNQNASIKDLELSLIRSFLEEVGSDLVNRIDNLNFEKLCRQMKIVGGSSEYPLPHNVGLMFFNRRPNNFFPQTQIDVVRFPSGTGGNQIIEKTFQGPINQQIIETLEYIQTTVIENFVKKYKTKAEADRFFNYPYAAIEEILVNAVYHRSYEIREPIEIRIYPEKIIFVSYPGPDRSISMGALAAGSLVARRYRNRRIGDFLKELRLTEGRGTGIPKAIRATIENGSPQPIFETDEDRTYFSATLHIHPKFSLIKERNTGVKSGGTPTSTPEYAEVLNDKAIDLLKYCLTARNRNEIQERLDLKDRKHIRERYIYPLLNAKLLVMTDPNNPLSRSQKFATSKLGREAIELYEKKLAPTLFDSID